MDIVASPDHTSFSSSSCFLRTQLNDPAHTLFVSPSPRLRHSVCLSFTLCSLVYEFPCFSPHTLRFPPLPLRGSLSRFNIFSSVVFQPGLCPLSPFNFVVPCCFKSTCVPAHSVPRLKDMMIISYNGSAGGVTTGGGVIQKRTAASSPEEVRPIEIQ